jgi:hypothetical protein
MIRKTRLALPRHVIDVQPETKLTTSKNAMMSFWRAVGRLAAVGAIAGAICYAGWCIGQGQRCSAALELLKQPDFAVRVETTDKVTVPKEVIEYLKQHKQSADQFDEKYGRGAAQYFLMTPAELLRDSPTLGHSYRDVEGALRRAREVTGCLD